MSAFSQRLAPKSRRVLAIVLLLLLVLLPIAAVAALAWVGHRHYDDTLFGMTRQLRGQTAQNATRPKLLEAVEVLKGKEVKKYFFKGSTPALAGAELQDLVKAVVEQNGGRVQTVNTPPHKDADGYRQVMASFQLSINVPNLRNTLYALETKEPYIFVDNLTVRSQSGFGYKPPAGAPEQEHFVTFDVSAFAPLTVAEPAPAIAAPPAATPAKPTGAKA